MQLRLNLLVYEMSYLVNEKKTLRRFIQNLMFLEKNLKIIILKK
jgi:hypothetical protein